MYNRVNMRPFTTNTTPKTTAASWWSFNKIPRQEIPHSVKVKVIRLHNKLRTVRAYVQAVLSNNPWDLLGLFGVRNWSPVPPGEHKSKFVAPGTSDRPNILRIIGLSRASRQSSVVKSGDVRPFIGVPLEVEFGSPHDDYAEFKAKRDKNICLECDLPASIGLKCKEHYDKENNLISSLSEMWMTSPNMGPRPAAMGQNVVVIAPGILEGIGQDRHRGEVA